jgi:hypothetical protein
LVATQSYVHHLETELHERDEQLEASQAQAADLQHQVEHLQELIPLKPKEPEEPEEDPEEIEACLMWTMTRVSVVRDHQGSCEFLIVSVDLLF